MDKGEKTRKMLLLHYQRYPAMQIRDIFKFLYHSAFGCEHLITSQEKVQKYIEDEYALMEKVHVELTEPLDGAYSRVSLDWLNQGLCAQTFAKLFAASAKTEENGRAELVEKLQIARQLICEGVLPFSAEEFDAKTARWAAENYPPLHHSEVFREKYRPAYRVIANKYIPFLPLFVRLDRELAEGRVLMAIEGGSASGKTTLGRLLESVYPCTVLHMDDFFLPPEKRTAARFTQVGGNVDWERFLEEVLVPLSEGKSFAYRKFDCGTMSIGAEETICPQNLVITEGAYSMHPELAAFYDFSVFLDVSPKRQRARILKRNTPQLAQRFFDEWIPLENIYFQETQIQKRCDMCITIE